MQVKLKAREIIGNMLFLIISRVFMISKTGKDINIKAKDNFNMGLRNNNLELKLNLNQNCPWKSILFKRRKNVVSVAGE